MKKEKTESQKNYGWFNNILYNIKSSKNADKKLFYCQFFPVIPNVTGTFLGIMLPAELVRGLENQWDISRLMLYILALTLGLCFLQMIDKGMEEYIWDNAETLTMYYEKLCYRKIMRLDYYMLEDTECGKLIGNAWNVLRNGYGIRDSVLATPMALSGILGVLWYGITIGQKNILIIVIAIVNSLLSMKFLAMARKRHRQLHEKIGVYTKESAYINKQSMDKSAGKDIRIYQMTDWLLKKYDRTLKGIDEVFRQIRNGYFLSVSADAFMSFLLNLFSYVYLINLLIGKKITVSSFVLYIGLVKSFSTYFFSLMDQLVTLDPVSISMNYIRNFLELEEKPGWSEGVGKEKLFELKQKGIKIELKDVSFRYPGKEKDTLSNINLVISSEEKLALIGLNGAGKTTLVKLICGFYRPTKGEILVNNIPVSDFSREEYYELVSVMFQDYTLLPMTLDLNLTGEEPDKIDKERLQWALKISGFWKKYESLPKKGETLIAKEANKEAIDFSGGEKQKFLFARALYKNSPLMILDEPTAALDPIAENEMYLKFDQAAKGKTCIYISHRLSSTRFCDRIILMEHGQITEEGTHNELLAKGCRYAELFEMQSRYYKDKEEQKIQNAIMEDDFEENFTDGENGKGVFYE